MGIRSVTKQVLTKWEDSYTDHLQESEITEETRSAMLNLQELKELVAYIDKKNQDNPSANIDGVEIYLTRSSECDSAAKINKITSKGGIEQISFAIVPLEGTKIFMDDGSIMCLFPGLQDRSQTGLCPPCIKRMDGKKSTP